MIFPLVLAFTSYTIGSYAVVLFKGWNVTIGEWVNPLRGFTWPDTPECIPDTQVFPGGAGVPCSGGAAGGKSGAGKNPLPVPKGETQPGGSSSYIAPGQVPGAK